MALEKFHYELEDNVKVSAPKLENTKAGVLRGVFKTINKMNQVEGEENFDPEDIFVILEQIFSKSDFNKIMKHATLSDIMDIFEEWTGIGDEDSEGELGK